MSHRRPRRAPARAQRHFRVGRAHGCAHLGWRRRRRRWRWTTGSAGFALAPLAAIDSGFAPRRSEFRGGVAKSQRRACGAFVDREHQRGSPHRAAHTAQPRRALHGATFTPRVLLLGRVNIMIFATFALGFFCPRHACEERDCGGRCSNETISLRCADTEVIRLVLLQTADDITGCLLYTSPSPRDS